MGGNCLAAALMLSQEAHPSSKLGDVPLKTSCIIFLMMLPPKQSQKIIQSYRRPWSYCLPRSYCPPWGILNGGSESRRGMEKGVYKLSVVRHKEWGGVALNNSTFASSACFSYRGEWWEVRGEYVKHAKLKLNNFLRCDKRPGKQSFNGKDKTGIRNQACLSAVELT